MKQYKVLQSLSEFNVGQIITKDSRSYDMYYSEDEEFAMDACIVENCPTVFEEIIELPYEIVKDEVEIIAIIRKSDRQRFQLGDNFQIKGEKGWNIIDELVIFDGFLYIVETDGDGEDKYIWKVEDILENMVLVNNENKEILEILEQMQNFYNESFIKITKILNK